MILNVSTVEWGFVGLPLSVVLNKRGGHWSLNQCWINYHRGDDIRVDIRGGSSVFDVSLLLWGSRSRNSDGCSSISDSEWEFIHTGCLMLTGQSFGVISIELKVLVVLQTKLLNETGDIFDTTSTVSHLLCRIICVASGTVPVFEKFGCETNGEIEFLSNSAQDVPGDPKHVSCFNSFARTNLVFPLSRHDFWISSWNFETGKKTSFDQGIIDGSTMTRGCTDRAVVGSLRFGVPICWPSQGLNVESVLGLEKGVLLFNTKPRFLGGNLLENLSGMMSEVCVSRLQFGEVFVGPHVTFTEHEQVIPSSERIRIVSNRLENNFWIVGLCLIARRAIIVPIGDILQGLDLVCNDLSFRT